MCLSWCSGSLPFKGKGDYNAHTCSLWYFLHSLYFCTVWIFAHSDFYTSKHGSFFLKKKIGIGKLTEKKTIQKWSQNLQSVPMLGLTMVILEKEELGASSFKKPNVRELLQMALSIPDSQAQHVNPSHHQK